MSSDSELASVVAGLQFGNYVTFAIATAVSYDYIITFSKEVDYIWNRPWTLVSALFILVRYLGLGVVLIEGLLGSTFISGPKLVRTALIIASDYAFTIFLAAADIVMILRVYAMYDKSRIVMGLLLVLYVVMLATYVAASAIYDNPNANLSVTILQVLDMSFCYPVYNVSEKLGEYKLVPRRLLAALLFAFAVARFCVDSLQSYRETRRLEVNQYIRLLVREGALYFFAHVFNTINFSQNTPGMICTAIAFVVTFTLSPRFIVNVRELHLRHLLRVQGDGIDTGFGFSVGRSSQVTNTSSIGFAQSSAMSEGDVEMGVVEGDTDVQH